MNNLHKNLDKLEQLVGQLKLTMESIQAAVPRQVSKLAKKGKGYDAGKVLKFPF